MTQYSARKPQNEIKPVDELTELLASQEWLHDL